MKNRTNKPNFPNKITCVICFSLALRSFFCFSRNPGKSRTIKRSQQVQSVCAQKIHTYAHEYRFKKASFMLIQLVTPQEWTNRRIVRSPANYVNIYTANRGHFLRSLCVNNNHEKIIIIINNNGLRGPAVINQLEVDARKDFRLESIKKKK